MSDPTAVTLPEDADPFEAAFKEFSLEGTPAEPVAAAAAPEPQPVEGDNPEPEGEPAADTDPAPEPQSAEGGEPEPEGKPAAEPDPADAGKSATESDAELLARLAALVKTTDTPAAEPQEQPSAQDEPPPFTPEETALLAEYEKEWGEVSKAESLKRRAEYDALVRYVFREVADVFRPVEQNLQRLLEQAQLAEVRGVVPQYDTVRPELEAWTEKQPAYLRSAYQHVIQHGTAEEIADLVARYNKENGMAPAPAPQPKQATELPLSAKQAAATLAPVSSRRSAVATADVDKNDFDSAFAKFAATTQ